MIHVRQHADQTARTARGCPWVAECEVGGVTYDARSRSGAPYALARKLVAAGIADAPVIVTTHGITGEMRYRSLHEMAWFTVAESATVPVRRERWSPPPDWSVAGMARSDRT